MAQSVETNARRRRFYTRVLYIVLILVFVVPAFSGVVGRALPQHAPAEYENRVVNFFARDFLN